MTDLREELARAFEPDLWAVLDANPSHPAHMMWREVSLKRADAVLPIVERRIAAERIKIEDAIRKGPYVITEIEPPAMANEIVRQVIETVRFAK